MSLLLPMSSSDDVMTRTLGFTKSDLHRTRGPIHVYCGRCGRSAVSLPTAAGPTVVHATSAVLAGVPSGGSGALFLTHSGTALPGELCDVGPLRCFHTCIRFPVPLEPRLLESERVCKWSTSKTEPTDPTHTHHVHKRNQKKGPKGKGASTQTLTKHQNTRSHPPTLPPHPPLKPPSQTCPLKLARARLQTTATLSISGSTSVVPPYVSHVFVLSYFLQFFGFTFCVTP